MSDWQLKTPVAFIIFNRPDTTERVFAEITKAKPPKLLVVADGPRIDKPGEAEKCTAARAIIDKVDWPCEVLTNFSETNLGCKNRVATGLDWVFEQVPEAIILEDDCLPDASFFRFCEELLIKYRNDDRVGIISGDNFQFGKKCGDASYYFSIYPHIWGWASWRRVWQYYDKKIADWEELDQDQWLKEKISNKWERPHWKEAFEGVCAEKIDTWDHQLTFTLWFKGKLTIIPNINLISNIGFGVEATHTKKINRYANIQASTILFPLDHPNMISICEVADKNVSKKMFRPRLIKQVLKQIKKVLKRS